MADVGLGHGDAVGEHRAEVTWAAAGLQEGQYAAGHRSAEPAVEVECQVALRADGLPDRGHPGHDGVDRGGRGEWLQLAAGVELDRSVVNSGAHSGTYAARVGPAPTPVENHVINGNSEYGHTVPWRNGDFSLTSASTTSSTYLKQSTTFTPGAGVTTARIYCHLVPGSGDGHCDEVTLTEP
ncbi:hypothetical protein SGFS_011600 [Streptomyces graminofaciens]|uniref:Uncharacterized protein n=1 Tax=Streptomyces graminofaciens TaxID=68212 RepID=A0ABN5V9R1_9ACTN|nr:hypothetical protein [Streptomyces graminofaciens]BBC29866.1 hypothetical protein SGFS_011600 [Streptomyces graminofaciens]